MALTYLNSVMIELPAHIDRLSTTTLSVGNFVGNSATTQNLSTIELNTQDINFPAAGGNIFNNTSIYGDLTITGSITALSGLEIIPTTFATTTALSVVNTGAGTPLFVSQEVPGTDSVFEVKGTGVSILKVNNTSPDEYQPGVEINFPNNGHSLKVSNNGSANAFVVTSGSKVGIGTEFPVSELQVIGKTTTTDLSSSTGVVVNLSSSSVNSNTIRGAVLEVDSFKTTQTVSNSSFNTLLTADNGHVNNFTASNITTNTLNALTANIDVLDIKVYEMSGFNIDGVLTVSQGVSSKELSADKLFVGNAEGNFAGNFSGGVINGEHTGSGANLEGQFSGLLRINPTVSTVPTLSTDPGNTGALAFDADYLYICVFADLISETYIWKRVALSAWN